MRNGHLDLDAYRTIRKLLDEDDNTKVVAEVTLMMQQARMLQSFFHTSRLLVGDLRAGSSIELRCDPWHTRKARFMRCWFSTGH